MTVGSIANDGKLVYKILSNETAGIGDNSYADGNGFVEGTSVSGVVIIPKQIGNYKITTILKYATRNCHKITKLILPRTLTTLTDASITVMGGIKELVIPASVTTIGNRIDTFYYLKIFIFERESKLTSIGSYFLQKSYEITELILPSSIQSIGENFLYNCTKIRSITYCGSFSFSSISNSFADCPNIKNVYVTSDYPSSSFGGINVILQEYDQCYTKHVRGTCQRKANYWFKLNILIINILIISY